MARAPRHIIKLITNAEDVCGICDDCPNDVRWNFISSTEVTHAQIEHWVAAGVTPEPPLLDARYLLNAGKLDIQLINLLPGEPAQPCVADPATRLKLITTVLEQLTDVASADGVVTWAKRLEEYVVKGV